MSDITQYFAMEDRIKQLESDNKLLRKKLKSEQSLSSKHKVKWRKLYEEHNPPIVTRSDKAMILIAQKNNGELKMTLRQIASKCFITYQHARSLSVTQRKNNV